MVPPNGAAEGTPRFGEQQKRLSSGRKISPAPGIRKSGSQPPTPEAGSPTKVGNSWGFQLSSLANASISRRGGASSFVAPVRESWGAGLRSPGALGTGGLTASSSQKSLQGEGAASPKSTLPSSASPKSSLPSSASFGGEKTVIGSDVPLPAARMRAEQPTSAGGASGFHSDQPVFYVTQLSETARLQREQVQDFLAGLKPGSASRSLSQSTLAPAGADATGTRYAAGTPPAPITRSRQSTPLTAKPEEPALGATAMRAPGQSFQEAVARQLEAHAERLVVLQRMIEGSQDRLQQLSDHVQRTGTEHQQRFEALHVQTKQTQPAADQLGKLVGHMQWAENRIHLLISRVAAGEEAMEQLRHHTVGPGRASWDTWEVAQARKDLDGLRDQLSQLRAAGVITPQALSEIVEPLRRDVRQLSMSSRSAGGGGQDTASLMETLMQEVMQVRELAARGERNAHRDTMATRQELQETSQSIRKEMRELLSDPGSTSSAASTVDAFRELRQEFQTSTASLRQELWQLADDVSAGQQPRKRGLQAKPEGVQDLAGRSTPESLQELAGIGAQFRELGKQVSPVSQRALPEALPTRGAESAELQNAAVTALEQAMEELRTWVLQLAPHCEQAAATRAALEQLRQDLAPLIEAAVEPRGRKEDPSAGDANGEIVGLLSRTSMLRALTVHGAALAMEASERSALANRRCDNMAKDLAVRSSTQLRDLPMAQGQPDYSSTQDLVSRKEFTDAIEDLKWELIHVTEQAEQGAHAAHRLSSLQTLQAADMSEDTIRSDQFEKHVVILFDKLWQERSTSIQQEISMVMSRTSFLRALTQHSIACQTTGAAKRMPAEVLSGDAAGLFDRVTSLEEDVLKLIARQSVSRAFALHGLMTTLPNATGKSHEELRSAVQSMQLNFSQLKEMAVQNEQVSQTVADLVTNLESLHSGTSQDMSWLMARPCIARAITSHAAKTSGVTMGTPGKLVLTFKEGVDIPAVMAQVKSLPMVSHTELLESVGIGMVDANDISSAESALRDIDGVETFERDGTVRAAKSDST